MQTILIIDDDKDTSLSLKKFLETKGYNVILAKSGSVAWQLVKIKKPDLILLDLLMPGIPISDLLLRIKESRVIIVSVVSLEEKYVAETGKKYPDKKLFPNVVDSIHKPFDLNELLSKIKKALS